MKSDFQISNESNKECITDVAEKLGIKKEDLILYGDYKAKIKNTDFSSESNNAKLILVTSINPTASGEGKSTVTIGLSDGICKLGKKSCVALREPSLGPVLGLKGGAAGGGYAQVVPMEDINLHFTGDMHAITTANNAISALIDNHIFQGNDLDIANVVFNRVLDMNDRALRNVKVSVNSKVERDDHFDITVASEVMAIICLAENLEDLRQKLGNILVAYNSKNEPIYLKELKVEGVITALLKDAIKPNIVQTLENNPALIHGGPFANIAHGCNSVIATKTALKYADYVVTEAGFGADLGAEKFFDIKCRKANLRPDAAVIVITVKAIKLHGGADVTNLSEENVEALKLGVANVEKHIENIRKYNVPVTLALNIFTTDTEAELSFLEHWAEEQNVSLSKTEVWAKGGIGAIDLANKVISSIKENNEFKVLYEDNLTIIEKINIIAKEIYGADKVDIIPEALTKINTIKELGFEDFPICVAKTPLSLSDNPQLKGRPTNFNITVRDISIKTGAGFIVVYTDKVLTMPGLSKQPNALKIDIDPETEQIINIF